MRTWQPNLSVKAAGTMDVPFPGYGFILKPAPTNKGTLDGVLFRPDDNPPGVEVADGLLETAERFDDGRLVGRGLVVGDSFSVTVLEQQGERREDARPSSGTRWIAEAEPHATDEPGPPETPGAGVLVPSDCTRHAVAYSLPPLTLGHIWAWLLPPGATEWFRMRGDGGMGQLDFADIVAADTYARSDTTGVVVGSWSVPGGCRLAYRAAQIQTYNEETGDLTPCNTLRLTHLFWRA